MGGWLSLSRLPMPAKQFTFGSGACKGGEIAMRREIFPDRGDIATKSRTESPRLHALWPLNGHIVKRWP